MSIVYTNRSNQFTHNCRTPSSDDICESHTENILTSATRNRWHMCGIIKTNDFMVIHARHSSEIGRIPTLVLLLMMLMMMGSLICTDTFGTPNTLAKYTLNVSDIYAATR